jgi:hypothetical protein
VAEHDVGEGPRAQAKPSTRGVGSHGCKLASELLRGG